MEGERGRDGAGKREGGKGGGGGEGGGKGKRFATLCNVLKWEKRKVARAIVESQESEETAVSWCSDNQMIKRLKSQTNDTYFSVHV